METYIRKSIKGYYIEFPKEIDSDYWEGKIGYTYQDFLDDKWILLSEEQLAFHDMYPDASIQEVLNAQLNERTLEDAKREKINQINEYDNSGAVNSFNINGTEMWLNVEEREQIATQISANEAIGRTEMTRWFNGTSFTFTLDQWKQMLIAVEVYAGDALNVTESHKAEVNNFTTIEEVDNYDYTAGYPEKLTF